MKCTKEGRKIRINKYNRYSCVLFYVLGKMYGDMSQLHVLMVSRGHIIYTYNTLFLKKAYYSNHCNYSLYANYKQLERKRNWK